MFVDDRLRARSVKALARAKAGAVGSAATGCKKLRSIGLVGPRRMERFGKVLKTLPVRPKPVLDCCGGPQSRFITVAIVASVGSAEFRRQVRARNAQTVIVPRIDNHVYARRHVTRCAGDCGIRHVMVAVPCGGVFVGRVALQTDAVTGYFQLIAVRVVAIAAGDAGRKHFALLERAVIVDFILHLPIGVKEPATEPRTDSR